MSMEPAALAFAAVIFAAYAVQSITGFGSMLLCVTFASNLMPIRDVVTLALPASFLQTGYIVARHHGAIRRRLLFRKVLPLEGLGLAVGYFAFRDSASAWLRIAFGVMVLLFAVRELWMLFRARSSDPASLARPISPVASFAALFGSGVAQGIFATGGPPLVYALGREGLSKQEFRSTLSAVFIILNVMLVTAFIADGRYDAAMLERLPLVLLVVPPGIAIGEYLHRRVDEGRFKKMVFALLIAAALSLILR